MIGTIRSVTPPLHLSTHDPEFDRFLNPAQFYEHPDDVLDDRQLSPAGEAGYPVLLGVGCLRGRIHASVAPNSRNSPYPVLFHAVMEALQRLDRVGSPHGALVLIVVWGEEFDQIGCPAAWQWPSVIGQRFVVVHPRAGLAQFLERRFRGDDLCNQSFVGANNREDVFARKRGHSSIPDGSPFDHERRRFSDVP